MRSARLDWIRVFAGFWVVLFHSALAYEKYLGNSSNILGISFFKEGHSGVALFYSLSGYLISSQIFQGEVNVISFIVKRIRKLFPLYYFLTLAFFVLAACGFFPINSNPSLGDLIRSILFIQTLGFSHSPVLYVGWSLEYEVLFYTFVAMSLLTRWPSIALLFSVGLLSLHSPLIFLPFLFGIFCAIVTNGHQIKWRYMTLALPLSCIILYGFIEGNWVVLLLMGLFLYLPDRFVFGSKLAKIFSDATYSIYLVQVFTIPIFFKYVHLGLCGVDIFIAFLGTVLVGVLCYLVLERNFSKIFDRLLTFSINRL